MWTFRHSRDRRLAESNTTSRRDQRPTAYALQSSGFHRSPARARRWQLDRQGRSFRGRRLIQHLGKRGGRAGRQAGEIGTSVRISRPRSRSATRSCTCSSTFGSTRKAATRRSSAGASPSIPIHRRHGWTDGRKIHLRARAKSRALDHPSWPRHKAGSCAMDGSVAAAFVSRNVRARSSDAPPPQPLSEGPRSAEPAATPSGRHRDRAFASDRLSAPGPPRASFRLRPAPRLRFPIHGPSRSKRRPPIPQETCSIRAPGVRPFVPFEWKGARRSLPPDVARELRGFNV